MASPRHRVRSSLVVLAMTLASAVALQVGSVGPSSAAPVDLIGTFSIDPGSCSGGPSGSYFRMILPTGTATGPFIENSNSTCTDPTYTLFTPGTDGGLVSGGYQPAPDPGFDDDGNSTANRIIRPVTFFGKAFSVSTNPTDLQVGSAVPAPVLRADGTALSGDLTAFNATWNRQAFNQGAPKPGGGQPGNTQLASGSYDPATGRYTLTWASQIVGGPFDNFTGQWHLEGTFRPAGAAGAGSSSAPTADGTPVAADAPATPAAVGDGTVPAEDVPTIAAPSTDGDDEQALAGVGATVTDESFKVPTALVLVIALLGIAGVIVLVALDRKPSDDGATP